MPCCLGCVPTGIECLICDILDCDEVNAQRWEVRTGLTFYEGLASRSRPPFLHQMDLKDLWALRHKIRMPHDPWQQVFELHQQKPGLPINS